MNRRVSHGPAVAGAWRGHGPTRAVAGAVTFMVIVGCGGVSAQFKALLKTAHIAS